MTTAASRTEVACQLRPTTAENLDGDQRSFGVLPEVTSREDRPDLQIHQIRLRTDIG